MTPALREMEGHRSATSPHRAGSGRSSDQDDANHRARQGQTSYRSRRHSPATFRSVFGDAAVRIRQLYACRCRAGTQEPKSFAPLLAIGGIAPELASITAKFAGARHSPAWQICCPNFSQLAVPRTLPLCEPYNARRGDGCKAHRGQGGDEIRFSNDILAIYSNRRRRPLTAGHPMAGGTQFRHHAKVVVCATLNVDI
jgi:hypothetical protein